MKLCQNCRINPGVHCEVCNGTGYLMHEVRVDDLAAQLAKWAAEHPSEGEVEAHGAD